MNKVFFFHLSLVFDCEVFWRKTDQNWWETIEFNFLLSAHSCLKINYLSFSSSILSCSQSTLWRLINFNRIFNFFLPLNQRQKVSWASELNTKKKKRKYILKATSSVQFLIFQFPQALKNRALLVLCNEIEFIEFGWIRLIATQYRSTFVFSATN